ncbi:hypothetical protein AN958_01013 [Leucoagaricus sp. SymC.cos]|nr:hypothetical protein AN958_01013 [Leucoagaricus sp. SymC.cos]
MAANRETGRPIYRLKREWGGVAYHCVPPVHGVCISPDIIRESQRPIADMKVRRGVVEVEPLRITLA